MDKRGKTRYLVNVAVTYVGTVIGAGFASGQEIVLFFTRYGKISHMTILVSIILFMCIGSKILVLGKKLKVNCYGDMTRSIFKRLAPFVDIYMFVAYMTISIAMFAGAGALFAEHYWMGIFITAGFAAFTIINGLDGLLYVNAVIIPVIFLFNIILFAYHIEPPAIFHDCQEKLSLGFAFNSIKSSLIYASYNIILCIGVMAPLGNSIEDKTILRWGGHMGGIIIGIMLFISNYCLLAYMPYISVREMPLLEISRVISPIFGWLYTFILWGAIFTTLIANLFSITSILESLVPQRLYNMISICIIMLFALFAKFGFSNIISTFYPILGAIGLIFIVYMGLIVKN